MTDVPHAKAATAELHIILLADCSGSMTGEKIASLNYAMRSAIPAMREAADENASADVLVRVIRFASGADWHVAAPLPAAQFHWHDLAAGGETDMGAALSLLVPALVCLRSPYPPILVLVSDGQPTDNFEAALQALLDTPQGRGAVRIAVAIGYDADLDVLEAFIGNPEFPPLQAFNADELVNRITWATTAPVAPAVITRGNDAAGELAAQAATQTAAGGLVW